MERGGDSPAIQAEGHAGDLSILKDYIRPKRTLRPSHAMVHFETALPAQLQHDSDDQVETVLAGERCRVHFAVNTLASICASLILCCFLLASSIVMVSPS